MSDDEEFDDYAAFLHATRQARARGGAAGSSGPPGSSDPPPEREPRIIGEWTVGRSSLCDYVVQGDARVLPEHCVLFYRDDGRAAVEALPGATVSVVHAGRRTPRSIEMVTAEDPAVVFEFGSTVVVGETQLPWHRQVRRARR